MLDLLDSDAGVRVVVESLSTGDRTVLDADLVVYSTGYHQVDPYPVLGEVAAWCRRDADGRPQVERDSRSGPARCSLLADRAGRHPHRPRTPPAPRAADGGDRPRESR